MPSADPYPWASLRPDNKTIFPVLFPVVYCDVPAIANGTADKTSVKFTHSVTYSCDEKHVLMGSSTARCQADGTLTSVPFCEAREYKAVFVCIEKGVILDPFPAFLAILENSHRHSEPISVFNMEACPFYRGKGPKNYKLRYNVH